MRGLFPAAVLVGVSSFAGVWTVQARAGEVDWSGAYFGGSLGLAFPGNQPALTYPAGTAGTDNVYFDGGIPQFSGLFSATATPWPTEAAFRASDFIPSLQAGYNFQQGMLVFGVEADASVFASGQDTWTTGAVTDPDNRFYAVSVSGGLDNLFTLRPRLGVSADRFLLYATGGLAAGHASLQSAAYLDQGYGAADWEGQHSEWKLGFVVGAGAEYALTDNLSVKLETMYFDLGSISAEARGTGTWLATPLDVSPYKAEVGLSGAIVRGGLNVRF